MPSITHPFLMPAEWTRHARTILAWPSLHNASFSNLGSLRACTDEVSRIAKAVARFELVTLLATEERVAEARKMFAPQLSIIAGRQQQHEVQVYSVVDRDGTESSGGLNLWMRDIAPTFVVARGEQRRQLTQVRGVDFNFNGWGERHLTATCSALAETLLRNMGLERARSLLITEGGALEVNGEGTLLAAETSIINPNRNPDLTRGAIEAEIRQQLGVSKIIWVPGIRDAESTDCHIDALARFTPMPEVVLLSRPVGVRRSVWMRVYEETREVLEREKFKVIDVPEPDLSRLEDPLDKRVLRLVKEGEALSPVMSYVNYYLCNGGLIVPQFGDTQADIAAMGILREVFGHERTLVPIYIRQLPLHGGGIHCATQQVPFPR